VFQVFVDGLLQFRHAKEETEAILRRFWHAEINMASWLTD